jgi:hypothetical protein
MAERGGGERLSAKAGDRTEGGSGWNSAAWAGQGKGALGRCHRPDPVNSAISKLFKKNQIGLT